MKIDKYKAYLASVAPILFAGLILSEATMALQLEEVLVTAQKRVESVQDIPMAIDVVSGENLNELGITSTADLDSITPGLVIQEAASNMMTITLRGVGTSPGNESFDQSVSMFVDGVYAGRQREFSSAMYDIERIEVIKGTQNSLLGKNTSLGAISLVTKSPAEEFGGFLNATYNGKYGSKTLMAAVDIPVNDFIYTRFATNQIDETLYTKNRVTGELGPKKRKSSFRAKSLIYLNDYSDVTFSVQIDDDETIGTSWEIVNDPVGQAAQWDPVYTTETELDWHNASFVSLGNDNEETDTQTSKRGNMTANFELENGYSLATVIGFSEYDNQRVIDADFSGLDQLAQVVKSDFEQKSLEMRLSSPGDGVFDFTLGFFYLDSTMNKAEQAQSSPKGGIGSPEFFDANQSIFLQALLGEDLLLNSPGVAADGLDYSAALANPNLLFATVGSLLQGDCIFLDVDKGGDVDCSAIPAAVGAAFDTLAAGEDFQQILAAASSIFPTTDFTINDAGILAAYGAYESRFRQDTKATSIFSQMNYYFTDNQSMTLGLRYTDEQKDVELSRVGIGNLFELGPIEIPALVNIFSYPLYEPVKMSRKEYNLDGSLNYRYEFGDANMVYLSYGKGTKSGGFADSATLLPDVPYDEEIAQTYELGFKGEFLDGAARMNAALFYTKIENYQYSQFTGIGFTVRNLQAQNKGFEMDGMMLLSEHLMLQGGFTFSQAEDVDTGFVLPLSPELTANLGINYQNEFRERFKYSLSANISHRDKMFHIQSEGPYYSDAVTRGDIRLGISDLDEQYELALVGKNITNELTSGFSGLQPLIFDGNNRVAGAEPPRTIAIHGNIKF